MQSTGQPPSQVVQPGHPIRFAVGTPEGPRSRTWTVEAGRSDGVIHLGRDRARIMTLSARRGTWRLEYTQPWAKQQLGPDDDRLISTWSEPEDTDGGWWRALTIVVPTTSLASKGWEEPASSDGAATAFWPAPSAGSLTQFDVLLGSPGHWRLSSEFSGEVGRGALAGPGALWVLVQHPGLSEGGTADIARRHAFQAANFPGEPRCSFSAVSGDDGRVVLFDFTSG